MGSSYSVFGLHLHSNAAIPGLNDVRVSDGITPDVEIRLGASPDAMPENSARQETLVFTSSILLESGEPTLRIWRSPDGVLFRLEYFDGMKFWLDRPGRHVWAVWPKSSSLEDAATYLLGPVLGLLLRFRGVTCLHASAVTVGDSAVAFVGAEGRGKSTTAAAMARRGHAVISDDIVALAEREGRFFVLPAYPYLCLWPDSVRILYGDETSLPAFSANWDKRQLTLAENRLRFETQPLALSAVYLLEERSADDGAPFLETPALRESLLALVADSYATSVLDAEMRAKEFELLGRLVATIPIRRLRAHEDASRIGGLCDLIEGRERQARSANVA